MKVEIDLSGHAEEFVLGVHNAIETNTPFIIYSDKDHYMRCYPQQGRVRTYANGEFATEEGPFAPQEFIDRVKLGAVAYDKFFLCEDERPRAKELTDQPIMLEEPTGIAVQDFEEYDRLLD